MANEYKMVIAQKKAEAARLMSSEQFKKISIAIHIAAAASATAGAIPIPLVDAAPITAIQISMVISLGKIFNRKISEAAAKGLISAVAATFIGRNLVKTIPVLGWGVSAAVAGCVTEAVGWTIAVDMAKRAKKAREQDNCSSEDTNEATDDSESADTERNDPMNTVSELEDKAKEFLCGQKKIEDYREEFEKLCSDIEALIDELPKDHQLLKYYDELRFQDV